MKRANSAKTTSARKRTISTTLVTMDGVHQVDMQIKPLSENTLQGVRQGFAYARDRITELGGDCSVSELTRHDPKKRAYWAKDELRFLTGAEGAEPWSFNDVLDLAVAFIRCELDRTIAKECKERGKKSLRDPLGALRFSYTSWREKFIREKNAGREYDYAAWAIAPPNRLFDENGLPVDFDTWIYRRCDYGVIMTLEGAAHLVHAEERILNTKTQEIPTLPMLYEPHIAPMIAAHLTRHLWRSKAIPRSKRSYENVNDALLALFSEGAIPGDGLLSFQQRSKTAFWNNLDIFNPSAGLSAEDRMEKLGFGRIPAERVAELLKKHGFDGIPAQQVRKIIHGDFSDRKATARWVDQSSLEHDLDESRDRRDAELRALTDEGPIPKPEPLAGAKRVQSEVSERTSGQLEAARKPRKYRRS